MPSDTEVLIVGAGPVGLSLAIELARRNVPFRIVDRAAGPSTTSKAVGVQARTLEVFRNMGVVDDLIAHGVQVRHAHFHVGSKDHSLIAFDELETPYPFILCTPQSETEKTLIHRLEALGGRVERETELVRMSQDHSSVSAVLNAGGNDDLVRARYLVGCDGAHSTVRHLLNFEFKGSPYPESLILADVKIGWDFAYDEMHMFPHPEGVMAFFPLPGGRFRIVADVTRQEATAPLPDQPTLEQLSAVCNGRLEHPIALSDPLWISSFRIHHRKVANYRRDRVFLAGDAAHIHSPAGGQGMNTGIQDVFNLAWKLELAVNGKAAPALLDSYSLEREPVARHVIEITDRLTRVAMAHGAVAEIRNLLLPFLSSLSSVRRSLGAQLSELDISYRTGPLASEDWNGHTGGPHAGDRAPVIDELTGTKFHLFAFATGEGDHDKLDEAARSVPSDIVETHLMMGAGGPAHEPYGVRESCIYLVRPDGYVGYRAAPPNAEGLRKNLARSISTELP